MTKDLLLKRRWVPLNDGVSYNLRLYYKGTGKLSYRFSSSEGGLIFKGDDFRPSPMHSIDSKESVSALMGFLTLQHGDTDEEYFEHYNERQTTFAQSYACEVLAGLVSD